MSVDLENLAMDSKRLEQERESYQNRLDEEIDSVYRIAAEAKKKGLDFSNEIEIPRASDLASRTQKLMERYLDPDSEN